MKLWKIMTTIFVVSFLLTACFPATPAPTSTPAPTPTLPPCASVQIVTPIGDPEKINATVYPVDSEVTIQWVPANCGLVVQSYQNDKMITDTKKPVASGTTLKIGAPGSGVTQIKVWWKEYEQSIWVEIK